MLSGGRSRVVGLVLVAGLALTLLIGCGDGGPEESATATPSATIAHDPTATVAPPAGDPGVTVQNAVLACREKNGDRLRSFVAVPVLEVKLEEMFSRGLDVLLKDRTVQRTGDGAATVTVHLDVRRETEEELVERIWDLELDADGAWRFTELPDCY